MDAENALAFYERLERTGLPAAACHLFDARRVYSLGRIGEISRRLKQAASIGAYPNLGIYTAGSYARGEASVHSDIDLWFVRDDREGALAVHSPNVRQISVMAEVIADMEAMEFPPPSNDGEFLRILSLSAILEHLGGAQDDYRNHFTARMLLILESFPVYGTETFDAALNSVIDAYFRDYEDHASDFRPTFLVNDILRYWKTLCLNYEHRRNQADDARRIKQKIKNFKLGYSRLLTCFATVALLSSYNAISKAEVFAICKLTPIDRLLALVARRPNIQDLLRASLTLYQWFLEKTEMSPSELEAHFSNRENRVAAFENGRAFGNKVYEIVRMTAEDTGTLRYLVV